MYVLITLFHNKHFLLTSPLLVPSNYSVTTMINKFLTLYSWEYSSPFHNLTELVTDLEWAPLVSQTTSEYFDLQGIYRLWTREMVESATRVNYGQDVDKIHALEGLCSLAANGATSVKGGNFRLFEEFVRRSNASLHLNTTVCYQYSYTNMQRHLIF